MAAVGHPSLHLFDYIVFGGMFVFTMGIGIRYAFRGKGSSSRETYFVGDRKMHFVPVALSLLVTYESSIMMLGLPAEAYFFGIGVTIMAFANLVVHVLNAYITVPLIKPLGITSIYEYIQLRFNSRKIRMLGVCLNIFSYLFYLSIVLYGQAVALEAVVGLNMWVSIVLMDVCAVIYTSLGGIKSVIWTDVFQAVIMFSGIFAVIIKGTIDTGGTYKVWEYANAGKRLELFNFDPDPTTRHTVWTMFLPRIISGLTGGFGQGSVQRIAASKSDSGARRMFLMAAPLYLLIYLLGVCEGIVAYAYLNHRQVEPFSCGYISNPNQILPYTVLVLFENIPGMAGLFMASLYSASLSTLSSGLSSISLLIIEDLLQPLLKNASDARVTFCAKISVVCLGAVCILLCTIVTFVKGPLHQVAASLLTATIAPLGGIFLMACFFPSVNKKGALIGLLFGFIMSCTLTIGGNFTPNVRRATFLPLSNWTCVANDSTVSNGSSVFFNVVSNVTSTLANDTIADGVGASSESYNVFFSLSYCLWGAMSIITTAVFGILASYILGRNRPGDVNPKYFLEISDSALVFLPTCLRRWLKGFGEQFKQGWKERETQRTHWMLTTLFDNDTTSIQ